MIYKPIAMAAWGFIASDGSQLSTVHTALADRSRLSRDKNCQLSTESVRIYTEHGGMLTARRCPLHLTRGKPLYCTRCGHFFSLTRFGLREVKPCFKPPLNPKVCHTRYPFMRWYDNHTCHRLMAATWVGKRPAGVEIDHINGDMLDWSADNLEYVTPAENSRRAKILRALRTSGTDPRTLTRAELLAIFDSN